MTIKLNGALGRVAELWGEPPSQREMKWLWMWLKYFFPHRPTPSIQRGAQLVESIVEVKSLILDGDIDAELEQLLRQQATSISRLQTERLFNQTDDFNWIDSDDRQLYWLIDHIHNFLGIRVPDAEARLSRRDYFICLMDVTLLPVLDKRNYLSRLHQAWLMHLKDTPYLNWFSGDDEIARCDFAWQIIDSRLGSMIGQEFKKYQGGAGVKCYFDSLQASEYEKRSHVDHIKKLWGQRKYREKLEKNKVRQRNFVLSDVTIKNLDKLAKELHVSRTEALERLIELAAKHGMPSAPAWSSATLDSPGAGNY
ncbi:hypothetical protein [Burkholderia sp. BE17]|uniref:hypothetical protein n=1 Tax=Burkholderia sp. BE17 TaxID=2656644 RepID=UPI00128C67B5|nr:hypothetical protein [Burkholderia sp. BE17]MPV64359.1 hypothetical protein [Burkholderia sp. BE17]